MTSMAGRANGFVFPEIKRARTRFRNPLMKYQIAIGPECDNCGFCIDLCPYRVYTKGSKRPCVTDGHFCLGPSCEKNSFSCITRCPRSAITVRPNPSFELLGDRRWTADLLASTWHMAETGAIPHTDLNYKTGGSGGGFDKLSFVYPKDDRKNPTEGISTSLELNRTGDGRPRVAIPLPFYLGGMSFGSVSIVSMLSRVRAATALDTFCCTGEGGYPDELKPYDDHVITQVPVARMREAVAGSALFSPFPFHSVYSVEDHKKHVDWIKAVNPKALVSVKVSTPTDVDMVAVGSFFAGAHIIQLDGSYGGTGAAPDIAKKNIAMPIEYAVPKVHRFLSAEGLRNHITIIASGGIRTAYDAAKIIALGADGVCLGTADLVALECIRCHHCESGRGCARGIATTDEELTGLMGLEWGTQRIVNMYLAWRKQLVSILSRLGMRSISELVGRTDVLTHLDYMSEKEVKGELD